MMAKKKKKRGEVGLGEGVEVASKENHKHSLFFHSTKICVLIDKIRTFLASFKDIRYLPHEDVSLSVLMILMSMVLSTSLSVVFASQISIASSVVFATVHFFVSLCVVIVYIYVSIEQMRFIHEPHDEHGILFPDCGLCDKKILTQMKVLLNGGPKNNNNNEQVKKTVDN